jgi:hypothetical protein
MQYEYDFGDGWGHKIGLGELLTAAPERRYPLCAAGERACPPEDCAGTWGYEQLIETIADPKQPDHEQLREWAGLPERASFDPARFDLAEANRQMFAKPSSDR